MHFFDEDGVLAGQWAYVFVGASAPPRPKSGQTWLDTGASGSSPGGFVVTTRTISASDTALSTDAILLCDGTLTVTLPTAATNTGRIYWIRNIGSGTVTVDGNGAEEVEGSATLTLPLETGATITSDGTAWWII